MIKVKAADPRKVGIWEVHPLHPDGEVFVSGEGVFEVGETPFVQERLSRGFLVEAKGEANKPEDLKPAKPGAKG